MKKQTRISLVQQQRRETLLGGTCFRLTCIVQAKLYTSFTRKVLVFVCFFVGWGLFETEFLCVALALSDLAL